MNTISTTASTSTILAIDLGKYKSVACVADEATGEFGFTTFDTTRAELQRLLAKEQPSVVIIEACLLASWVHDLCVDVGVCRLVANTASEAWKFLGSSPAGTPPVRVNTGRFCRLGSQLRTCKKQGNFTGRQGQRQNSTMIEFQAVVGFCLTAIPATVPSGKPGRASI